MVRRGSGFFIFKAGTPILSSMMYIALLRGINVGGHTVRMDYLRQLFAELGFQNVRTYIQSGNVFFETDEANDEALAEKIETHLHQTLGYDVPVFVRTVDEVEKLIALDPFNKIVPQPDLRFCIVFTNSTIPKGLKLPITTPKQDMEIIGVTEHEAFVVWHIVNGRPPSPPKNFFKDTIGNVNTSRFFHTTVKILEAARKA